MIVRTRIFSLLLGCFCLAAGGGVTPAVSPSVFAATKVPTSKIIVPEDAPLEDLDQNEGAVPLDELTPSPDEPQDTVDVDEESPRPIPEVFRDFSKLPEPVRKMRSRLIEATATGELEKLRPLMGTGDSQTILAIGGHSGDPIKHLKKESGDIEGQEIMAILAEILEAGYVHLDKGTTEEMYVWPYFFAYPLDKLTPPMRVELFRVLTAGDLEDSAAFGSYIFYRTGIKPDGTWSFFVAGD